MSFSITNREYNPQVGVTTALGNPKSAAAILYAALITSQITLLKNMPCTAAIIKIIDTVTAAGCQSHYFNNDLELAPDNFNASILSRFLPSIKDPVLLLPVILATNDKLVLEKSKLKDSRSNGSLNIALRILQSFGAAVWEDSMRIHTHFPQRHAARINLQDLADDTIDAETASDLAIVALLTAISVPHGSSIITLQERHPVIEELLSFLSSAGYKITKNNLSLSINRHKTAKKISFKLAPVSQEILNYTAVAALFKAPMIIRNVSLATVKNLNQELRLLEKIGIHTVCENNSLYIPVNKQPHLTHLDINFRDYSIPPQHFGIFALLLSLADTSSIIRQWPRELQAITELNTLGFDYTLSNHTLSINPAKLYKSDQTIHCKETNICVTGMLAAMVVTGTTTVDTHQLATAECQELHRQLINLGFDTDFKLIDSQAADLIKASTLEQTHVVQPSLSAVNDGIHAVD